MYNSHTMTVNSLRQYHRWQKAENITQFLSKSLFGLHHKGIQCHHTEEKISMSLCILLLKLIGKRTELWSASYILEFCAHRVWKHQPSEKERLTWIRIELLYLHHHNRKLCFLPKTNSISDENKAPAYLCSWRSLPVTCMNLQIWVYFKVKS